MPLPSPSAIRRILEPQPEIEVVEAEGNNSLRSSPDPEALHIVDAEGPDDEEVEEGEIFD